MDRTEMNASPVQKALQGIMPLGAVLCLLRLLGFQRNIHAFAYLLKL